eukprot:TRINITY_DN3157_c0_g3_i1.p1 TRINITY_DN3157_c0_g3~~TRINITY_DN3157_c0_g3_i1.p1  ORF type:complete len:434 (+),score=56.45 TRINITY_DN3157_c0_g3_i1:66-1367(+)
MSASRLLAAAGALPPVLRGKGSPELLIFVRHLDETHPLELPVEATVADAMDGLPAEIRNGRGLSFQGQVLGDVSASLADCGVSMQSVLELVQLSVPMLCDLHAARAEAVHLMEALCAVRRGAIGSHLLAIAKGAPASWMVSRGWRNSRETGLPAAPHQYWQHLHLQAGTTPLLAAIRSGALDEFDGRDPTEAAELLGVLLNPATATQPAYKNPPPDERRPPMEDDTPLLAACERGLELLAAELVSGGAHCGAKRVSGVYAVNALAVRQRSTMAKWRHEGERRAFLRRLCSVPQSALNSALVSVCFPSRQDDLCMADVLLEAGADPSAEHRSTTALLCACTNRAFDTARGVRLFTSMVEKSPRDAIRGTDGMQTTPLHMAVKRGAVPLVKVLVEYGANPAARDKRGRSPRDFADTDELVGLLDKATPEGAAGEH